MTTDSQDITIEGDTTLGENITINTGLGGGDIRFLGALNGINTNVQNLTATSGYGDILFEGEVGDIFPLENIVANSNGTTRFNSNVVANNLITDAGGITQVLGNVTTLGVAGVQDYQDVLELIGSITLTANEINFGDVVAGTGDVRFQPVDPNQDIAIGVFRT